MLKQILMAATCAGFALCAAPVAAGTFDADQAAIAQAAPADAMIVVTAKMPASVASPRSQHVISNEELDEQRGGEQLIVTNQTLNAVTQGNVLNGGFLAGDVNISDSALSGFNGVGNILINTGAQVSLQTGMNLTINIGE